MRAAMRALKIRLLKWETEIKVLTDVSDSSSAHAAQMQTDRREMADHATRLLKRAEEAEVRAARAEKALKLADTAADNATTDEEDLRRDLGVAQTENRRLRHAVLTATQATAHMSTVAALLTGEDLDNA
jgi:hypothetical protein